MRSRVSSIVFFLVTDVTTGAPRGFGYAEFDSVRDAQEAVEQLNGASVNGSRPVRVDFAPGRSNGGGRSGGGGRREGGGRGGGGGYGGGRGGGGGGYGGRGGGRGGY